MPQDKFVTREQAKLKELPMKRAKALETWTDKGWKAGQKAYDKTIGDARGKYLTDTASDRDAFAENRINELELKKRTMGPARRLERASIRADIAESNAMKLTDNKIVAKRDATNARITREQLASRAAQQNQKVNSGGGVLSNPMLGVAASIAEADRATGYKRAKYTGNFGGPSFSANPYASKSSYVGQSPMSKMMGVGKKSK